MAGNIKKIVLQNFKAFNGVNEIDLEGKHLLLYGENGSGKSSIYWGLYTLLQSITKTHQETDKYFDYTNEENLINRDYLNKLDETRGYGNYTVDIGKNVQIEFVQEDDTVINLSLGGLSAASDKNELENLNRYSDFLTHRLLINFYNFRNSQEIDLWKVFKREIFPFIYENSDNGENTIEKLISNLYNNQPFTVNAAGEVIPSYDQQDYFDFYAQIGYVNSEISRLVSKIENDANEFFSEFFDTSDNEFKISLFYTDKFFHGTHKVNNSDNPKLNDVANSFRSLRTPKIFLRIFKKAHNSFELITRPQTFLNEALITQLSLSIRLALTKSRAVNYPGQFLVLDDLLVSLDMSNRDKVLDIMLDVFASKYKIYILTHERAFFNMVRSRLAINNLMDNWNVKEMYMNTFINPYSPIIVDDKDYLSEALKHLKNFDYPASANYLRKECESRLKQILPDNLSKKITDEETKYKQLEDLISAFIKYYKETLNQNPNDFLKLKHYKDILFNPLSHDNLETNYYKEELLQAHNLLIKLRLIRRIKLVNAESKLFIYQSNDTGIFSEFTIVLKENLNMFELLDSSIVNSNVNCIITNKLENGINTALYQNVKFNDLQKIIYKYSMKTKDITETLPSSLKVLFDEKYQSIEDLLSSKL